MNDSFFIKKTLALAAKAKGMTSPNPMVGALIVKNNKIIAECWHKKPGTPHAEALVIEKAGDKAKGSTIYVNLEPCCHTDKRTPPCTKAIIRAGIAKVVVAMKDPNPKVSGRGIRELENSGIEVLHGIMEKEARDLNEAYIKYITTRQPFVILKVAMTLDGKIATPEGESKWITSEKSRLIVHRLRGSVDAVMTAIGTVRADDPELTSRIKGAKNPIRIIIDPRLETPLGSKALNVPPETIIVARISPARRKKKLVNKGIKLIEFDGKKLSLRWLMERLGEMEISSIMIEGGSSLNAYALEDGIVDKAIFFIAPKIIGGSKSLPAVGGGSFRRLADAHKINNLKVKKIGDDLMVEGYLHG